MSYLLKAGIRLDDLSPDEAARIPLEDVVQLRRELFTRVAATLDDGPAVTIGADGAAQSCGAHLRAWAARMTQQHQRDGLQVHQVPDLPWLAALLVVVWGEAPMAPAPGGTWRRIWPAEWTPALVERALAWEDGRNIPAAVTGRNVITGGPRPLVLVADLTTPTT